MGVSNCEADTATPDVPYTSDPGKHASLLLSEMWEKAVMVLLNDCVTVQEYEQQLEKETLEYVRQDAALTELEDWTMETTDLSEAVIELIPRMTHPSPSDVRTLATLEKQFRQVSHASKATVLPLIKFSFKPRGVPLRWKVLSAADADRLF